MWELDYKEGWTLKNWGFWSVVLEKTLESPLDCKEIQPVHPKGDQSWVSIGRTDVEAETPILWSPDATNWLIWKDPDAGRDWGQEEKGTAEDEMAGWHHLLSGHEFEYTPGVGDGQGGLACCGSWGCKELDMTEWLNWTEILKLETVKFIYSFQMILPLTHEFGCCGGGGPAYSIPRETAPFHILCKEGPSHCIHLPFHQLFQMVNPVSSILA